MHRSRDRLLFRDAIIALDGRCAGASHRDTAEVIFGIKRVREDWSARGGWLKEPMRRALAKCAATAAMESSGWGVSFQSLTIRHASQLRSSCAGAPHN